MRSKALGTTQETVALVVSNESTVWVDVPSKGRLYYVTDQKRGLLYVLSKKDGQEATGRTGNLKALYGILVIIGKEAT